MTILGNNIESWGIAIGIVAASVIVAKILYWVFKTIFKAKAAKTKNTVDDAIVDKIEEPIAFAIVILGLYWGYHFLQFNENVESIILKLFSILVIIDVTWMLARLVDAIVGEWLVPAAENGDRRIVQQVMPVIRKGVRSLIWIIGFILAFKNAGYDVGALLAGLGIGGLAMALAAKDFVANIFGGITVFVDKPFQVGDRIQIDGYDGTIHEVGIRSTRLKTLAGRMVTIPNHKFTDSYVENVSSEPTRKISFKLGITYDTPMDKINDSISYIKDILANHEFVAEEFHVWFSGFADSSLDISIIYYINSGEDIIGVQHDVNQKILVGFNSKMVEFAFPTTTILHKEIDSNSI